MSLCRRIAEWIRHLLRHLWSQHRATFERRITETKEMYIKTPAIFATIGIDSVDDLMRFIRLLQDPRRFIYRGQSDAAWTLETRVERKVPQRYKELIGLEQCEQAILERFKRRAHHYLRTADIPQDHADLEWLALIQHYGGPTRLLDFTKSIFVAAYFAVGTLNWNDEAAIWAINWDYLSQNLRHKQAEHRSAIESAENALQRFGDEFGANEWIIAGMHPYLVFPAAVSVEPFRQNRRLLQQQGLFVAPININQPFADNLSAMFDPSPELSKLPEQVTLDVADKLDHYAVIKLVIARERYPRLQADLRRMNIATETVFPDLDGEARALSDILTEHIFVEDALAK